MLKAIVVDDEIKIRKGITNLINNCEGYIVLESFEKPKDAIIYMENNEVDLVVTDIKMPEISGLEFIEKIQGINKTAVIVILSGYSDFSYAQKAIELGTYRYLTKPTDIKEFIEVLDKIRREYDSKKTVDIDNLLVLDVIEYIETNYNKKLSLVEIAEKVFISPSYLSRLFKKYMNKNLNEYILEYRMEKAKIFLKNTRYNINEVANLVGYTDTKYFSSSFKKLIGVTPVDYRNRN